MWLPVTLCGLVGFVACCVAIGLGSGRGALPALPSNRPVESVQNSNPFLSIAVDRFSVPTTSSALALVFSKPTLEGSKTPTRTQFTRQLFGTNRGGYIKDWRFDRGFGAEMGCGVGFCSRSTWRRRQALASDNDDLKAGIWSRGSSSCHFSGDP